MKLQIVYIRFISVQKQDSGQTQIHQLQISIHSPVLDLRSFTSSRASLIHGSRDSFLTSFISSWTITVPNPPSESLVLIPSFLLLFLSINTVNPTTLSSDSEVLSDSSPFQGKSIIVIIHITFGHWAGSVCFFTPKQSPTWNNCSVFFVCLFFPNKRNTEKRKKKRCKRRRIHFVCKCNEDGGKSSGTVVQVSLVGECLIHLSHSENIWSLRQSTTYDDNICSFMDSILRRVVDLSKGIRVRVKRDTRSEVDESRVSGDPLLANESNDKVVIL